MPARAEVMTSANVYVAPPDKTEELKAAIQTVKKYNQSELASAVAAMMQDQSLSCETRIALAGVLVPSRTLRTANGRLIRPRKGWLEWAREAIGQEKRRGGDEAAVGREKGRGGEDVAMAEMALSLIAAEKAGSRGGDSKELLEVEAALLVELKSFEAGLRSEAVRAGQV
jgi:hypothetical protein